METTIVYWGYIGIMEKKMETTIVYWGYIDIMERNMGSYCLGLGLFLPSILPEVEHVRFVSDLGGIYFQTYLLFGCAVSCYALLRSSQDLDVPALRGFRISA